MKDESAPEKPDLAALAKRFLDLWQEQLTALAGDPELAEGMSRFMAALPPGFPFWFGPDERGRRKTGAASAGAASDERGRRVVELAARLDAVEARLARLESGLAGKRPPARGKPKRSSG
jgi:hypothetical protein